MSKIAGVTDKAVKKATGHSWSDWLSTLDRAGAAAMDHKNIAGLLRRDHNLSGWWAQKVAVGYEQQRGLREVHQKQDGYEATKSRTFPEPVEIVFEMWMDEKKRAQWLSNPYCEIRKSTKNRSIRITWHDQTNVEVYFQFQPEKRSTRVSIQHNKLEEREDVDKLKTYWHNQLLQLAHLLEYPHGE